MPAKRRVVTPTLPGFEQPFRTREDPVITAWVKEQEIRQLAAQGERRKAYEDFYALRNGNISCVDCGKPMDLKLNGLVVLDGTGTHVLCAICRSKRERKFR